MTTRLAWAGAATVARIAENLTRRGRTVLKLPANYHYALSVRLYDTGRARNVIDLSGDPALLARIAEVSGLGNLRALITPMLESGARVRLRSPAPHLMFYIPAQRPTPPPRLPECAGEVLEPVRPELVEAL